MSANGYLTNALTRHQIFIQRFGGSLVKQSLPMLKQMAKDIRAALLSQDLTDFQTARLLALQYDIAAITSKAATDMQAAITPSLTEFAAYEAQFTTKLLQGAVTVELAGVSTVALGTAVERLPMTLISGQTTINTTFAGIFDTFVSGVSREVMTAVQAGITAGQTTSQITADVMAMVNTRSRAQAETVVRTAANSAGSAARAEVYRANADVLKGEEWTSVLDGNTTDVCQARDGQIYDIGEGPYPPAHYNCRSVRIPIVDDRFAALREGATRASMNGPVSAKTTYNSWLKQQSSAFQDEVLGLDRAKLFRGGMPVSKFVDESGKTIKLAELKKLEDVTLQ
jgi:SPP1 gp7 family putative phage head morphogenesis protein